MSDSTRNLWRIDELCAKVQGALTNGGSQQSNGQVRELPDVRMIRYYTTLGLLDRPAQMRGRTAFYGRRHLLQLVAVKRLQAQGLSLLEIQMQLLGLSNAKLARIALQPSTEEDSAASDKKKPRSSTFWLDQPAPVENKMPISTPMQGLPLSDEVILMLKPARPLNSDDMEAIRVASTPLLNTLQERGLT